MESKSMITNNKENQNHEKFIIHSTLHSRQCKGKNVGKNNAEESIAKNLKFFMEKIQNKNRQEKKGPGRGESRKSKMVDLCVTI